MERAIFAGGCFWCMQLVFDKISGVLQTTVGYCGGSAETADYDAVCSGSTNHAEAIAIDFDPSVASYANLLKIFWKNIDPTTVNQQFADAGPQYRTAIFCTTKNQLKVAAGSKQQLNSSGLFASPIVTEVLMSPPFYSAEDYHQKYYEKQPERYQQYSQASGRNEFIQCTWKPKPS